VTIALIEPANAIPALRHPSCRRTLSEDSPARFPPWPWLDPALRSTTRSGAPISYFLEKRCDRWEHELLDEPTLRRASSSSDGEGRANVIAAGALIWRAYDARLGRNAWSPKRTSWMAWLPASKLLADVGRERYPTWLDARGLFEPPSPFEPSTTPCKSEHSSGRMSPVRLWGDNRWRTPVFGVHVDSEDAQVGVALVSVKIGSGFRSACRIRLWRSRALRVTVTGSGRRQGLGSSGTSMFGASSLRSRRAA